jgi:hypothetical protein
MLLEDIRHAAQRIQDFTSGRSLSDYQRTSCFEPESNVFTLS